MLRNDLADDKEEGGGFDVFKYAFDKKIVKELKEVAALRKKLRDAK